MPFVHGQSAAATMITLVSSSSASSGTGTGTAPTRTDRYIYCCGGTNALSGLYGAVFNQVSCYHVDDKKWMPNGSVPAMEIPRCSLAVVAVDSRIFAIGGWTGTAATASCEMYDHAHAHAHPGEAKWRQIPSMKTARYDGCAVSLGGRIYVFGGTTPLGGHPQPSGAPHMPMASAECFDTVTNLWSDVPPMPTARHGHRAVVLDDYTIAVMGGAVDGAYNQRDCLNTVDLFDTRSGWSRAPWTLPSVARHFQANVLADGRLVIASANGGFVLAADRAGEWEQFEAHPANYSAFA